MLSSLQEKVDPANAALLIIDVQNDYFMPGGAFSKLGYDTTRCQEMIPHLSNLIAEAREVNLPVVYIMSIYNTKPNHYLSEVWLEHKRRRQAGLYLGVSALEEGTWGCEIADAVRPLPGEAVVVKHRYDAFLDTDLDLVLRSNGVKSVILTGLTTNVCVETTARAAYMRDYYVVFASDCTASHEADLHEATLKNIDKYFGVVTTSDQVVNCWREKGLLRAPSQRIAH